MLRIAIPLLVLFAGCERAGGKKVPPAPVTKQQPKPAPAVKAPASVPQDLADRIEREWPTIEKEGNLFMEKLAEATKARESGDRPAMNTAVKAAHGHFDKAAGAWGEITAGFDDLPSKQADACWTYVRSKERQYQAWMEKMKALAQFSTAK